MTTYITSCNTLIKDLHALVEASRDSAYKAVNSAMLDMYWNIGKRIVEEEQKGDQRAEYGKKLLKTLSDDLTVNYGKGFSDRNLRYYRKFYIMFPDKEIWNACVPNLTWTHFRALLRVDDEDARIWYMREAYESGWSSRTYSVLHDNDRLFMSKYLTYMPTKEQLKHEIEKQKSIFYAQHPELDDKNDEPKK